MTDLENTYKFEKQGNEDEFFEKYGLRILRALRKIIQSVDIYSRKLHNEFQVTAPQMICLYALSKHEKMTQTDISQEINLSKSTINGIIDRLESKNLVVRRRDITDRRKVFVEVTPQGKKLTESAPPLLQDKFTDAVKKLPELEQAAIALSLERVVELMNAEGINISINLNI